MRQRLAQLTADERGATVIEYALVAGLIAVALSASFLSVGNEVDGMYDDVDTQYTDVNH